MTKSRPFGGRRSPYPLVARSGTASRAIAAQPNRRPDVRAARVAYAPSPAAPKAGGAAAYRIQLAAYVALDDALRGREILARRLLGRLPPLSIFERNTSPGSESRVNFRLRSRDVWSRSQAEMRCRVIETSGQSCLPIRHAEDVWRVIEAGTAPQTAQNSAARPLRRTLAAGGRLYRVQFAAYIDLTKAIRGKEILTNSLPANFPPLEILKKNGNAANDTPINYWVRSQGAWGKSRARALCAEAQLSGRACFLVEANSAMWQPVLASR